MFANYSSKNGLTGRVYKTLKHSSTQNNNSTKKQCKDVNFIFLKKYEQLIPT